MNQVKNSKMKEFYTRTISAIIIFPPALYAISIGGFLYFILLFLIILLAGYEWNNICGKWSFGLDGMILITTMMLVTTCFFMENIFLGFIILFVGSYTTYIIAKLRSETEKSPVIPEYLNRPKWFFLGSLYLSLGFGSMALIAKLDIRGITLIWVFLATITSDIAAYIFGSILKGKKIAPSISPGKSWSGFFSAMIATAFISYLFGIYTEVSNPLLILAIGALIAFFAHLGDMIESAFKRYVNIKDTSNLIPGHGGILDRIDAVIMVAMFIAILSIILGKSPLFL